MTRNFQPLSQACLGAKSESASGAATHCCFHAFPAACQRSDAH